MPTPLDIISGALRETGLQSGFEAVANEDAAFGLEKLNRLWDRWAAKRELIYAVNFAEYTLVPNLAPHTIGPTGTFVVPVRPVKLVSANFVLTDGSGSEIDYPLHIMNDQEWADVRIKGLATNISRAVYYEPQFPNGSLYFWPVPTSAFKTRLETWTNLAQNVTLNQQLFLPPGYWDATVLSLGIELCSAFNRTPSAALVKGQKDAMRAIVGNNSEAPLLRTNEGMDRPRPTGRPDFYFPTGEPW